MRVAIAGAHGKIAMRLSRLLVDGGHQAIGLIRNPAHADEVRAAGARPVICDLEQAGLEKISAAVNGAEVVVFAAGAGPGSGAERKMTMDRDGAIKLLEASAQGRARYLMVSSIGAEAPPSGDAVFSVYVRAKAEADAAVMATDRDWTIVRPGALTDDPGTGRVRIDTTPFRSRVPRDDVAAVVAQVIAADSAHGQVLYVNGGEEPIESALTHALSRAGPQ
jgi:nucleoside-diphosphate-sugar epimerase